jgi:hypothetical protein
MLKGATAVLLALSIGACAASYAIEQAAGQEQTETIAAGKDFFKHYVELDKTCDPKLVDLYSDDARISSGFNLHTNEPRYLRYSKREFSAMIAKTFADPIAAKISKDTEYGTPTVALNDNVLHVRFRAFQAQIGMLMDWSLRKETDGQWRIYKEFASIFRRGPEPWLGNYVIVGAGRGAKPEMHGIDQIREFKRSAPSDLISPTQP